MIAWWLLVVMSSVQMHEGDTLWIISPDNLDTAWISCDSSYAMHPENAEYMKIWEKRYMASRGKATKHQVHWVIPALVGFFIGGLIALVVFTCCRVSGDCARCEECEYRKHYGEELGEITMEFHDGSCCKIPLKDN